MFTDKTYVPCLCVTDLRKEEKPEENRKVVDIKMINLLNIGVLIRK